MLPVFAVLIKLHRNYKQMPATAEEFLSPGIWWAQGGEGRALQLIPSLPDIKDCVQVVCTTEDVFAVIDIQCSPWGCLWQSVGLVGAWV